MSLQPNLESVLQKVNNFINIDADRKNYTEHFSNLQNLIFKNLREIEVFSYMFNGFQLGGSYGDNVKVSLPNEFDLVFHITFPEQGLINVIKDDDLPGNVFLDFTKVLHKIANEKQHTQNLSHLKKWLDGNNHLIIEKLQLFLQTCFAKVLTAMENQIIFNGNTAALRYKREGPAHTIYVRESVDFEYSVDFVPGILLNSNQCVLPNMTGHWEAIPKPSKTNHPNYTSFRASYYKQETAVIKNKYQLKTVYRLLKKFRDTKANMSKMKSYFIKTIFLHKASKENADYWRKPLAEIIIDMFKDLESSLQKETLPFFWDENLNLYERYTLRLIRSMLNCVESSRETLQKSAIKLTPNLQERVYQIFLDANEYKVLICEHKLQIEQSEGDNTEEDKCILS